MTQGSACVSLGHRHTPQATKERLISFDEPHLPADSSTTRRHDCREVHVFRSLSLALHRKPIHFTVRERLALVRDGARRAACLPWHTDRRAELHQRLVEVAGALAGDQSGGFFPQPVGRCGRANRRLDSQQACQHSSDVAIDDRLLLVEGYASDGACGVAPDARERASSVGVLGDLPAIVRNDFPDPGMQ